MTSQAFSFDSSRPIYEQIIDYISNKIATGELQHGDKLDSVRELASTTGVNPNTVQRAYMELERKGIVEIRRGQGTFVAVKTSDVESLKKWKGEQHVSRFIEQMRMLGFSDQAMIQLLQDRFDERRNES